MPDAPVGLGTTPRRQQRTARSSAYATGISWSSLGGLKSDRKVAVGRGHRMVGAVDGEEGKGRLLPRRHDRVLRLERGAARLVLQALRGQVDAERRREAVGVAAARAANVAIVGGEAGRAVEAPVRNPWIAAALRQVL